MSESEILRSLFSLTALSMKTHVNTGQGVREVGAGGWGEKRDISYHHSDLMYIMCSMIREAETQPAGVCDSRGNSCFEIIGTKEVSGRKVAASPSPSSECLF